MKPLHPGVMMLLNVGLWGFLFSASLAFRALQALSAANLPVLQHVVRALIFATLVTVFVVAVDRLRANAR